MAVSGPFFSMSGKLTIISYHSNIYLLKVLFCFRAEAIYLKLSKSHYVSNSARRILDLPLVTEQDLAIQAKALQQQQMQVM